MKKLKTISLQITALCLALFLTGLLQVKPVQAETAYSTIPSAAEYVRTQMLQFKQYITFSYEFPDDGSDISEDNTDVHTSFSSNLFNEVYAYTKENALCGDYLRWNTTYTVYDWNVTDRTVEITYQVTYYQTSDQESYVTDQISEILSSLNLDGKTDKEKIYAIYDYVCKNVGYDTSSDESDNSRYTAYNALYKKSAVCQGYSNLLYRLLREAGFESRIIAGTYDDDTKHSWNIVKMGDAWYSLDATLDRTELSDGEYVWFLCCSALEDGEEAFAGHTPDAMYASADFFKAYPLGKHQKMVSDSSLAKIDEKESVEGFIEYTCKICGSIVETVDIPIPETVRLSASVFDYSGKAICPKVTAVLDEDGNTIASDQYKVSYQDNKKVGTGKVLVTFTKERYDGVLTKTFSIKNPYFLKTNASKLALKAGQSTGKFKVSFYTKDAVKSFKSSNTKVFTVSGKSNGKCTIKACKKYNKKACKANLLITLKSGLTRSIPVTIQKSAVAVSSISGVSKTITLKKGKSFTLKPVINPITAVYKASYTTSKKTVATVSAKGVIKAKKAGTATIKIKAGKKSVSVKVIVK